ncbi:3-hydroxybutyryl-CoA dehydrogenase [Thermoanaerobaculum aquaticum]|uniref:3-hydroxybutyryl-CoA dehydrogenase n=1 Tax=Thermoanaerobaculum aquaticum TaxID=1312852 RepID=A0A062XKI9_9BACT|nr:3-hydroxybutyryl-CoA dehydrogenase [Thermoanaerobaculum aquaticum]KDA53062.1 3-hydroxybutyryl-CoA dehydrogenase [Thermoanaerobaculum aquaticum]
MEVTKFGVVGAGQMGNGIAHVAALAGLEVVLSDVAEGVLQKAMATIAKNMDRQVAKGTVSAAQKDEALARITTTTSLEAFAGCQLVVEAVVEDFAVKAEVFRKLDGLLPESAILASNTSSISITKLAGVTGRPDRFIGMHFFNPVPVMQLVEIVRGIATSAETFQTVEALAKRMGKTPVEVNDFPGFVSNRVLMPMINEAIYAVYEGVATPEAVDAVMKLGMNHPMGPLQLADFIGLDTCLAILKVLYEGFGDPKYRPCPLLVKMVDAGWLGRKSGRGFYQYNQ